MKKSLTIFFLVLMSTLVLAQENIKQRFVPGELIVKFKPSVRAASVKGLTTRVKAYQIREMFTEARKKKPGMAGVRDHYLLRFEENQELDKIIQEMKKDPNVEAVSRNTILHIFDTTPNDPYYASGDQYGLVKIKCPQAWDITTGESSTSIAVLDTGINYYHVDLAGKADLVNGYDFVHGDNDPLDDHSGRHGSTVSGVIAATTNNSECVAGVNWGAKILPIKVLDSNGDGTMANILDGLAYARSKSPQVINMSFGQYSADSLLEEQCRLAYEAGIVLVAAAGNGNTSNPSYPAYYSSVIAVAAVDSSDKRSVWGGIDPQTGKTQASNYGTWVDVAAPGTSIYTTSTNTSGYAISNGTSLASPFIAGVAGLIKGYYTTLTPAQVVYKITSEADNIDSLNPGFEHLLGSGRVNLLKSLTGNICRITSPGTNSYVKGSVPIYGSSSGSNFSYYVLQALQNNVVISTIETSSTKVDSGLLGTWNSSNFNGSCSIVLKTVSQFNTSEEASITLLVDNATPEAAITSPAANTTVTGEVPIVGTAKDPYYFDYYVVQYGQGQAPATFETITTVYASKESSNLATWNTTGLNGDYTLKIISYNKSGAVSSESFVIHLSNSTTPTKEPEPQPGLPLTYPLPNPFDRSSYSSITFNYSLAGNFVTKIYVFDLNGNLVWQSTYNAGENGGKSGANNPAWDGKDKTGANLADGVYLYQVIADGRALARGKLIILN